jgi:hypothetical protein
MNEMPGFLKFLFGMMAAKTPAKPAAFLTQLATDENMKNINGKFFKAANGKEIKSSGYSYDREVQEKLWSVSEELTR